MTVASGDVTLPKTTVLEPAAAARHAGVVHDFVMPRALRQTHAAGAAVTQTLSFLHAALHTGEQAGLG